MRNLILIFLLLSITCKSQSQRDLNIQDAKHYYAGVIINVSSYTLLSQCIKGKTFLKMSISTGLGCLAGYLWEEVHDGYFHLGVKNWMDTTTTCFGSFSANFGTGLYEIIKRDNQIELFEKYGNLNDTLFLN